MRIKRAVGAVAALALLTVTSASYIAATDEPAVAATTKTVAMFDHYFKAQSVKITKGSRVRWVNKGQAPHTTTNVRGRWDRSLLPGESFTRTFKKVGKFKYYCKWHGGMTGVVVVVSP